MCGCLKRWCRGESRGCLACGTADEHTVDHEDSEQEAADPKNGRGRVRRSRRRRMRKKLGVAGVSVHALPVLGVDY
jgi:hypothetical protein